VTFARLNRWDVVAFLSALALLFAMAADWYSTVQGEEARRIERISEDSDALNRRSVEPSLPERAAERAEGLERNAWEPASAVDAVLLVVLLAVVGFAVVLAFTRAAGRRFEPPLTPSATLAVAAALAGLLVAYRIVQQPGSDVGTTVKVGAPVALVLLGLIALAASRALGAEEEGREFRPLEAPGDAASPAEEAQPSQASGGRSSP